MTTNENINENNHRLQELGGSDYQIVEGESNIKGWDVKDAQGNKLGEVDELLFDEEALKVRYIVLNLDDNDLNLVKRKVLVPIGMAEIHEKDDDVILPNMSAIQIESMAEYDKDNLTADIELKNYNALTGSDAIPGGDNLYNNPHFTDENLYRNRSIKGHSDFTDEAFNEDIDEQFIPHQGEVKSGGILIRSRMDQNLNEENFHLNDEEIAENHSLNSDLHQDLTQEIELPPFKDSHSVNNEFTAPDNRMNDAESRADMDPANPDDRRETGNANDL